MSIPSVPSTSRRTRCRFPRPRHRQRESGRKRGSGRGSRGGRPVAVSTCGMTEGMLNSATAIAEASEARSRPTDPIGRRRYDLAVAEVIASANGWRRFLRAVANASSLAVRTTTICS